MRKYRLEADEKREKNVKENEIKIADKLLMAQGHRQRVRQQIRRNGLRSLTEHHLVEYLLFFGIPRRDTKRIAYELITRYGNLFGIANAPYEELKKIKGMTESAILFFTELGDLAQRYLMESGEIRRLRGVEDILSYLRKVVDPRVEACYFVTLSSEGEMLSVETILEGVDNSLDISPRIIVRSVLNSESRSVILVHNHPSGSVAPSLDDRLHTFTASSILCTLGTNVVDHLIIYEMEAYSFKNNKFYKHNWRFR